jgi:hypothetical protein
MSNHFHLVVETPQANLVAGMKWLLGTYTSRFNRRHKVVGHLFSGRYKALIVDGSGSRYLQTVCDYVHLNPVRAKLLTTKERPKGDRQKARIALRLREETTMTWDWIAEKLAMGVGAHAAHCVRVSGYAGLTPSLVSGSGVACCIDGYVLATRTALR